MTRNGGHHCAFCGAPFVPTKPWPRSCDHCDGVTAVGLITLVTLVQLVDGEIAAASNHPLHDGPGKFLPATFLDFGETWRQAATRLRGSASTFRAAGAMSDAAGVPRLYAQCLKPLEELPEDWQWIKATELTDSFDRNFLLQLETDGVPS